MREHIYNTGYRSLYVARAELPSWGKDGKEGVEDI
jgi:hypothetical protein